MITIFDIANTLLQKESMSNKKLQKLCYYVQAWYLALNDKRLFDDDFEAWIHGPVCPDLYHTFKNYGFKYIPKVDEIPECVQSDGYLIEFINNIYDIYKDLDGDELEELTHQEDPWINARSNLEKWQSSNNIISDKDMHEYYSSLYEN